MEALTGEDLQKSAQEAAESASGPDQQGPGDLKKRSPLGHNLLAIMLNNIEAGANWPEEMNQARAALMAKDEREAS